MPFGGGKVDQAAFGQHVQPAPVAERILFHELARLPVRRADLGQRFQIDLHIEVPGVAEDRAVLHALEMIARDHVLVAGHGDENVADGGSFAPWT